MRKHINSLARLLLLLMASMFSLQPPIACAASGDLDTTFAGTGKARIGFGGGYAIANAAAVQADGKLILAGFGNGQYPSAGGDFLIARLDTNNVLDILFGDGGRVTTRVSPNYPQYQSSAINALAVLANGQILAAGFAYQNTNYSNFTWVRYNPDGSLDTTLGTNGNGIVYTDFGQQAQINAMAIQFDGKIVVAGLVAGPGTSGFALARYNTNGVLDASFGSGGTVTTTFPNSYTRANGVIIQPDGQIVAVGTGIASGDSDVDIAVFRYTANGALDTSFGGTGEVFTRISPVAHSYSSTASAVTWQRGKTFAGSRIVVAGVYENDNVSPKQNFKALIRYYLDGSLDTSFGNGGIVIDPVAPQAPISFANPTGVIAQGQINQPTTVGGWGYDGTSYYYFLTRYTSSGALDTTFGANNSGEIRLSPGSGVGSVQAGAFTLVQQTDEFVVAGYQGVFFSGNYNFAAARFTSSGLIDTGFGSNGLVLADVSDAPGPQANAVAVQPDGKIVAVGASPYYHAGNSLEQRFTLARLNSDGTLDASFGSGGKLTTIIGSNDLAHAVAIQPDGKIVAAGSTYTSGQNQLALARYHPDGSLDISFGNNGTTTALVGTRVDQVNAVKIQSDGKIIAAGTAADSSGNGHFALARFSTNGLLDNSFGNAGKVVTSISTYDGAYGIGIQANGKIVLSGAAISVAGSTVTADFALAGYNTNGALDFSFGSLGRTTANAGGGTLDAGFAMAIQPDGKIIVAGVAGLGSLPGPGNPGGNGFVALARFTTNGALDTSFGSSGTVVTEVGAYSDYASSLALQPDGKIVVAGATQNGRYQFFAQRYNSDGTVDGSFGNGVALIDFGTSTNEFAYGLTLDSLGRLVIAGDAGGLFGIARLQSDFSVASPSLRIFLTSSNTVVISWPYPSAGWNLQQNDSFSAASWLTPPETVNNDGTNNFIITSHSAARRFYRLAK